MILDRKWENGITPAWAAIFSRRERGWLTVSSGMFVLQSFTRDRKGDVIAANVLEVSPWKAELGDRQILRISGPTRGKAGTTPVDYTAAGNVAVTVSVDMQHWNLLKKCISGMGKERCLC